MSKITIFAALMLSAAAAPVVAQDISGASVSGTYRSYTDDNIDLDLTTFEAGIEVGITDQFALGGNIGTYNADNADDVFNATVRGSYKFSPTAAIGLFAAQDSDGDNEANIYGFEGGSRTQNSRFEAYYGVVDSDDIGDLDITVAGIGFEFSVSPGFALGLNYASQTIDDGFDPGGGEPLTDLTFSDTSIVARYSFANGPSVFAEIGQISASARTSTTLFTSTEDAEYIGIGAEYSFGGNGGNIFSNRTYAGFGY